MLFEDKFLAIHDVNLSLLHLSGLLAVEGVNLAVAEVSGVCLDVLDGCWFHGWECNLVASNIF